MQDYEIVGSYDNQRVSTFNAERTINMFEYLDDNGKKPKALFSTAGLVDSGLAFTGVTAGAGSRGSFVYKNVVTGDLEIYQIFGNGVFRITGTTNNLVDSLIGLLNTTEGYVGIDANTYQIIFVDGQEGFIWDINQTTFTKITDTSFPAKPIDVCYIDGFFLVANGDTNQFQLCLINQGMVWGTGSATFTADATTDELTLSTNGSNFATGTPITLSTTGALPSPLNSSDTYYVILVTPVTTNPAVIKLATTYQNAIAGVWIDLTTTGSPTNTVTSIGQLQLGEITSHPGTIVACKTLHRRVFLFSQFYTEVWENAGLGDNLPLRRNNSLLMEVGTPAIASVAVGFDRLFFLAQDRDGLSGVMEVTGTEAQPVSNKALDYQLAQYYADPAKGVADARGILIKENGLIFYRLNFTLANHTFVLNVSMSTSDQVRWHEEEVLNHDRHPAQTHAFFNGVNYYGSYDQNKFYIVDPALPLNDGEPIRRVRIGRQYTPPGYNRLRIDRFHLDLLQGRIQDVVFEEIDLLAEDGDVLLTESGIDIILEQEIPVSGADYPVVFLSISRDGGQTFGYNTQAPMGRIGERTFRTVWRKLGTTPRGQGFVPKIEFFTEIPFIILGAAWAFEVLPE